MEYENRAHLQCIAEQAPLATSSIPHIRPQSARTGQWSADGTCLVHVTADNSIETIVLEDIRPEDLLENDKKHDLTTYSRYEYRDPIYSTALYPRFWLGSPNTTLVLYAARDTPVQLRNALDFDQGIYATYAWNDPNNEAVITPRSLVFTSDATHFVAGAAKAQFAIYDVNRPSSEPAHHRRTSKSRYALKQYGSDPRTCATSPHSIITAMDVNSTDDILAIGTNTRNIALYADHGLGDLITSFKLPRPDVDAANGTRGVTQVKWSPDGTYLFVAERQSDTVEVYDVRQSCRRLSWLSGRRANVSFQMAFDVATTLHGLEVWAGGVDGRVRMWSNPEQQEGEVKFSEQWSVHNDPACATFVHASGSVVATLATQDRYANRSHSGSISSNESSESGLSTVEDSESSSDGSGSLVAKASSEHSESQEAPDCSNSLLKIWSIT